MANNSNFQSDYFESITGAFDIAESDNVIAFSIQVVSGDCTIKGSAVFRENESETITIPEGGTYTRQATLYNFLKGYTFNASGTTIISIQK